MFPSPYVPQKCFPVPLFPKLTLPSPCVPQYPCFPYSPVPMFPSPYVPQSQCTPVHLFPIPCKCSSVPMFPKLIHQSLCSPLLFHRSFHPLYSPNMFPSPYVPQCICSPNMFPSLYVPLTNSPAPMFPSPIPQKCSPLPYVPQTCSPVPMFPSEHMDWGISLGSIGKGNTYV